jgi:hypothetical protein
LKQEEVQSWSILSLMRRREQRLLKNSLPQLCRRLKPARIINKRFLSARLKPCPDTKLTTPGFPQPVG